MVSSVAAYGGVPGGAEIASVALLAGIVKLIYDGMRNSIQSSKGASDVTVMPMPDSKGDGFIEYLPLPDLDKGGKIETFPEAKEKTDTIVADPPAEEEKESIFADPLPEEKGNQIIADVLSQEKIDEILDKPKGERPNPSTYLDQDYIDEHLAQFEGGVTKIVASAPSGTAGPPGGTFVMPSNVADEIIAEANGDVRELEILLGLKQGDLGEFPVRVDIDNTNGLRMPSGNEKGATSEWIPGGYTSGGIPEAIIDSPPVGDYTISNIY